MSPQPAGTAIVTGASTGIGAVFADRLARRGHDLILVARNAERLGQVAARVRADTGREVEVIVADLADPAAVTALADRIASDASITLLVNNAGVSVQGGMLAADPEALRELIAINITAPTLLSVAAANAFIPRKAGAVVNISSVTAFLQESFDGAYSGTKAYVLNLTQALAAKAEGSGVRFQAVLPGPINTEMWGRSGVPRSVIPQEAIMEPQDLVDAALAGLDNGEVVTLPTVADEGLWTAYETARHALRPQLIAGQPAARYRVTEAA